MPSLSAFSFTDFRQALSNDICPYVSLFQGLNCKSKCKYTTSFPHILLNVSLSGLICNHCHIARDSRSFHAIDQGKNSLVEFSKCFLIHSTCQYQFEDFVHILFGQDLLPRDDPSDPSNCVKEKRSFSCSRVNLENLETFSSRSWRVIRRIFSPSKLQEPSRNSEKLQETFLYLPSLLIF